MTKSAANAAMTAVLATASASRFSASASCSGIGMATSKRRQAATDRIDSRLIKTASALKSVGV